MPKVNSPLFFYTFSYIETTRRGWVPKKKKKRETQSSTQMQGDTITVETPPLGPQSIYSR